MAEIDYPEIVELGGGHGLAAAADAISAEYPEVTASAFTTISDSGSATGVVRDELGASGVGAYGLGDLRNVLGRVSTNLGGELFGQRFGAYDTPDSIAERNDQLRTVLEQHGLVDDATDELLAGAVSLGHRLQERDQERKLSGHSYGNLVLASAVEYEGLVNGADRMNRWLQTRARVQPISSDPHHLVMYDNGAEYFTEDVVDSHRVEDPESARIWLTPSAELTDEARAAIERADILVIAPGSLWTSTLPVLAVNGIAEAFRVQASRPGTSRMIVANLVHEPNAGAMPLKSYVRKIEELTETKFRVIHNTAVDAIPATYDPLDDRDNELGSQGVGAALVSAEEIAEDPNDPLTGTGRRSGVFHDPPALARAIIGAHRSSNSYVAL